MQRLFGAEANTDAGRIGSDAQHVHMAGDGIELAGKARHPEAVDHAPLKAGPVRPRMKANTTG